MVGNEADMTEHPDDIFARSRIRSGCGSPAPGGGDTAAAALVEDLRLPLTRVRRHLNRLAATGVARLQPDGRTYRLDPETLRWAAQQVGPPRDAGIALGAANEDEEAVVRTFFRDGRLTEIGTKASKRRVVLERISIEFDPGIRYDEREVNAIVGAFLNDHAALRRYLVDERFLDRDAGVLARGRPRRRVDAPRAAG
jgi:hypothetical protein